MKWKRPLMHDSNTTADEATTTERSTNISTVIVMNILTSTELKWVRVRKRNSHRWVDRPDRSRKAASSKSRKVVVMIFRKITQITRYDTGFVHCTWRHCPSCVRALLETWLTGAGMKHWEVLTARLVSPGATSGEYFEADEIESCYVLASRAPSTISCKTIRLPTVRTRYTGRSVQLNDLNPSRLFVINQTHKSQRVTFPAWLLVWYYDMSLISTACRMLATRPGENDPGGVRCITFRSLHVIMLY